VLHLTNSQKFSKGQILFLTMAIIVIGLLVYANISVFNLFTAPMFVNDIVVFAALAMAVTLTIIFLVIIVRDKSKAVFLLKEQKSQNIVDIKESEKTSNIIPLPINFQKTMCKTEPNHKIRQTIIPEQKNLTKTKPNKVICPACRREFELPIYLGDLIVDFGSPKPSNIFKQCTNCGAVVALKQKGASEVYVWKE
jgi:hypothetical protein